MDAVDSDDTTVTRCDGGDISISFADLVSSATVTSSVADGTESIDVDATLAEPNA